VELRIDGEGAGKAPYRGREGREGREGGREGWL